MTDIIINIKTGSDNSEPKVTTTADSATAAIPNEKSLKEETPKEETPKEEITSEKETQKKEPAKKDDSKKMDMTAAEHAKMGAEK